MFSGGRERGHWEQMVKLALSFAAELRMIRHWYSGCSTNRGISIKKENFNSKSLFNWWLYIGKKN